MTMIFQDREYSYMHTSPCIFAGKRVLGRIYQKTKEKSSKKTTTKKLQQSQQKKIPKIHLPQKCSPKWVKKIFNKQSHLSALDRPTKKIQTEKPKQTCSFLWGPRPKALNGCCFPDCLWANMSEGWTGQCQLATLQTQQKRPKSNKLLVHFFW